MSGVSVDRLVSTRFTQPDAISRLAMQRKPFPRTQDDTQVLIIAADHTARGVLGVGGQPDALHNRADVLNRVCVALQRPGVAGVLGTPDVIEDLLMLGVLEEKLVFGSMNRGGLADATFGIDDRYTAYTPQSVADCRLDGGKLLLRMDLADPATAVALEAAAHAVTELAGRSLVAMVEPFMATKVDGQLRNILTPDAVIRSIGIASAIGATSARTWLKLPVVDDMSRVLDASSLPVVILGGDVSGDQTAIFERWRHALRHPACRGIVAGRTLLYPPDDDVAGAVDTAVELLQ